MLHNNMVAFSRLGYRVRAEAQRTGEMLEYHLQASSALGFKVIRQANSTSTLAS